MDADTSFLSSYVREKNLLDGQGLSDNEGERNEEIEQIVDQIVEGLEAEGRELFNQKKWRLKDAEVIINRPTTIPTPEARKSRRS
jgi:hypothetical protein